ncbi:putative cadmium-transporting ATPase [compost metagenome]
METLPKTSQFQLIGLDCPHDAAHVEEKVASLQGVEAVRVHPVTFSMIVTHAAPIEAIRQAVSDVGYQAELAGAPPRTPTSFWGAHGQKIATLVSGVALLAGWLLSLRLGEHVSVLALYGLAALVGGFKTLRLGLHSLRRGTFDMNALMTLGITGAVLIGEWAEAGLIAFLYAVSNWLEAATMERTRNAIQGLLDLAPQVATVRRSGQELTLPVAQVAVGDVLIVKPGEKVAMDGTVLAGSSLLDQAPITGESMPVPKEPGSEVFAGSLNGSGALEVTVTKRIEDTTLAKIIHMVEAAQSRKASVQTFVDRFARWYTPAVLGVATLLAVLPPLMGGSWSDWLYRALALIVLACPCALVVSTPVALVAGIGNAARRGVLIKGGTHLEAAASVQAVAFDKTGTLTAGRPEVRTILPLGDRSPETVIRLAAAVEARSEHPLAAAILRHADKPGAAPTIGQDFEAIVGHGAKATIDGKTLLVGSPRFFEQQGHALAILDEKLTAMQAEGQTVVLLGDAHEIYGLIGIADPVRPEARHVVSQLKRLGIGSVVMITGDNARTARAIADVTGVDAVQADLLPADKVTAVRDLEARHGRVVMVGDGINDAPALASAHLGVAMGAAGTDVAIETADVALMADDLRQLPFTLHLSRQTMRIIRQNIVFALGVKAIATLLVFPGWLTLWMAVLSDMGATVLVILNGMRLLRLRPEDLEA